MSEKGCYYGVLKYSSKNIGDEIQSIAASRFLPRIDKFVQREKVSEYKSDKKTKLIMNGWYMWKNNFFPPSNNIEPLLISMYFNEAFRKHFNKKQKDYLIEHGPVGCRDKSTLSFLEKESVPAYFSGCMTLTLERNPEIKKKDFILAVDIKPKMVELIRKRTNRPVFELSVLLIPNSTDERLNMAKAMLYLYQSAHCVVSSRLHVCMPCTALQTPVLMLDSSDNVLHNDGRYEGLKDLCRVVKEEDFINGNYEFDFDNPPENPKDYLEIRNKLIETVSNFTGYNDSKSKIPAVGDEVIITLINAMKYDYSKFMKYIAWFVEKKDLLEIFLKKKYFKKDHHDIL